ncbi:hypothetical protein B0H14DRAFT_3174637 [Mycena olivaceomarginata]|nr:hypothetical protein B0H14DRAFT_3174637 [Mycena olivaceomarginata]
MLQLLPNACNTHEPDGYLFVCPSEDFRVGPNYFGGRIVPPIGRSIHLEPSVYDGLRQFHRGKGFNPDSQEAAIHYGYPLYELSSEPVGPLACAGMSSSSGQCKRCLAARTHTTLSCIRFWWVPLSTGWAVTVVLIDAEETKQRARGEFLDVLCGCRDRRTPLRGDEKENKNTDGARGWHGRASGGQDGLDNLGKFGERQAAPLTPVADCVPSRSLSRRTGAVSAARTHRRTTDSCRGAGGAPPESRNRGVRASVIDGHVGDEVQHLPSSPPPSSDLSSRSVGDEDCEGGCQRKRATGGGGVAMSMDGYSRIADHVGAEVGRGRSRPWEQKAGTTACASRPAACAASPASASARIHRCIVPVRVCGRLSFPIVPYPPSLSPPLPGTPSAAARSTTRVRLRVIPEISPRPPRPLVLLALRAVALEPSRSRRA